MQFPAFIWLPWTVEMKATLIWGYVALVSPSLRSENNKDSLANNGYQRYGLRAVRR